MRLTVVSDLHLDTRTGGAPRHDDIERALFEAVDFANQKSDYFICLGDAMDPDSGSCVFRAVRTLVEVTERLRIPSIWLAGNHDVIEDGSGETTLEPLKGITFGSRLGTSHVTVIDRPGIYSFEDLGRVLAFPFTAYSHKYEPKKFLNEAEPLGVNLVIGHLNVKGAQPGDESEMIRGRDVWLPVSEIRKSIRGPILNGHIHRRQITEDGVHIPGSLERLRFDEERHQPGWMEVVL